MRAIFLLLLYISIAFTLDCMNCGVFLTAPTQECRGKPINTSCAPENIGCLTITAQNGDGSYYVEKRCATKAEDRSAGCQKITIRGIQGKECLCKEDLCNGSFELIMPIICLSSIVSFIL